MRIALVGNQNSGKSSLFNLLTGMNQKIGNWPGVTIERKSGIIKGTDFELIDLPGIYSLSPYTPEEVISRDFLLYEKPDIIINIIDTTSVERSLYLTTQLMELDSRIVIALNMADLLDKKGLSIDIKKLEEDLGTQIIPISALKETGIDELIAALYKKNKGYRPRIFSREIEKGIDKLTSILEVPHKRFVAVRILEKDEPYLKNLPEECKELGSCLDEKYRDLEEAIAKERYDWIERIKEKIVRIRKTKTSFTDHLDKIFLNKYLGIPIFVLIMFLVYFLSVGLVGGATVDLITESFEKLKVVVDEVLLNLGASSWSRSLVVDGVISGVGAVLNFVPQLIILFLCIALLETSGYMSRISFLLDKVLRRFGLSGKALIPFIVGSGCSVPAVMAARTVEDSEEREMLITLTPFIPCSAKLPIVAMFAGFFFDSYLGLVTASLYFASILIIIFSALLMKKFVYKKLNSSYISELPEYRIPSFRYVVRDVLDKTWDFIKRAGTIIFAFSVIIWFLLSFSWKLEYGIDVDKSILASIGNLFSWVFYPILGELSWGATVSALQGLVAKEQVVSSMTIISGFSTDLSNTGLIFQSEIFSFFTPASAYAFMAFNLFSAPCLGTIGAMHKEFRSMKKTLKAVFFQTALAWVVATLIHLVGRIIMVM